MILFFSANNKRNINHVTFSLKRQKKKKIKKRMTVQSICVDNQPASICDREWLSTLCIWRMVFKWCLSAAVLHVDDSMEGCYVTVWLLWDLHFKLWWLQHVTAEPHCTAHWFFFIIIIFIFALCSFAYRIDISNWTRSKGWWSQP